MGTEQERLEKCRALGFKGLIDLHKTIQEGTNRGVRWLRMKNLSAKKLQKLGYDLKGMRKLGYSDSTLEALGYDIPRQKKPETKAKKKDSPPTGAPEKMDIRSLIDRGYRAGELKEMGVNLHHCRIAGLDARELMRAGYDLAELRYEYNINELQMAGFDPRELSRYFTGQQLQAAGFSAQEMRCAGFSVRDLLRFGYNENQIIAAGFSTAELLSEGLARHTSEIDKLR